MTQPDPIDAEHQLMDALAHENQAELAEALMRCQRAGLDAEQIAGSVLTWADRVRARDTDSAIFEAARLTALEQEDGGADEGAMVTGVVFAIDYVDGEGDHRWALRFLPEQSAVTTAGLVDIIEGYRRVLVDVMVGSVLADEEE